MTRENFNRGTGATGELDLARFEGAGWRAPIRQLANDLARTARQCEVMGRVSEARRLARVAHHLKRLATMDEIRRQFDP